MTEEKKDIEEALRDAGAPVEPAITLDEKVQILGEGMAALQSQWTALQKDIKEGQERFERILASQGTVGGQANPQTPIQGAGGQQGKPPSMMEQAFGAYVASQMQPQGVDPVQKMMMQLMFVQLKANAQVMAKAAGISFKDAMKETDALYPSEEG